MSSPYLDGLFSILIARERKKKKTCLKDVKLVFIIEIENIKYKFSINQCCKNRPLRPINHWWWSNCHRFFRLINRLFLINHLTVTTAYRYLQYWYKLYHESETTDFWIQPYYLLPHIFSTPHNQTLIYVITKFKFIY